MYILIYWYVLTYLTINYELWWLKCCSFLSTHTVRTSVFVLLLLFAWTFYMWKTVIFFYCINWFGYWFLCFILHDFDRENIFQFFYLILLNRWCQCYIPIFVFYSPYIISIHCYILFVPLTKIIVSCLVHA